MAGSRSASPPRASSPKRRRSKSKGPTTLKRVVGAITAMKDKKGSSAQALRKYMMANTKNVPPARMNAMLRRALVTGLKSGVLVRPKGSTASGSVGRFRVGKQPKLKKKAKKAKKPKKAKKAKKSKKPKAKKTKKAKKPKAKKAKKPKAKKSAKKSTKARPKVKKPKKVVKKASKKTKK